MIKIENNGKTIAIIIPSEFDKDGIHFFTPNDYSQQLAYMKRPAGYIITSHTHNIIPREVFNTLETLFIRKGKIRVDFYSYEKEFLESYELKSGDVLLLASGGHGFEMIEETEMIEVKQGPFLGDQDKVRF
jgi:hypothetical protein